MIKTKSKAMKTKQIIIDKTMELFQLHGVDKVSTNDIIKALGISRGGFYYHFKSKNELIYEVLIKENFKVQDFYQEIKGQFNQKTLLKKVISYMYQEISNINPKQFFAFLTTILEKEYYDSSLHHEINIPVLAIYTEIIKEGISNGEFRSDLDEERLVDSFFHLTLGIIYSWGNSGGKYDLLDNYSIFVSLLTEGLLPRTDTGN